MLTRFDNPKYKKPQPYRRKDGFIVFPGVIAQGGIGFDTWAEDQKTGNGWTSFTPSGSGGFTGTSDGTSVAIMPTDISALDGDIVEYTFTIDTLSAGQVEFSIDESGVTADSDVDNGVVTKVTGGTRSGAQAIFTSTGAKVVVIQSKKTNGADSLRPKFKYNQAGGNIVISGFTGVGGQSLDMWTGAVYAFDFDYRFFLSDNLVDDTDGACVTNGSTSVIGDVSGGIFPKLGDGALYGNGTLYSDLCDVIGVTYDSEPTINLGDWTEAQATAEVVTFGGYSNVLKVTCGSQSTGGKGAGVVMGSSTYENYKVEIYVPSTNSFVDGVYTYKGASSQVRNEVPTPDTWKPVSYQVSTPASNLLNFFASDGAAIAGANWSGDVFYIRLVKLIATNTGGTSGAKTMGLHSTYPDFSVSVWLRPRLVAGTGEHVLSQCNNASTSSSDRNFLIQQTVSNTWQASVRNTLAAFPSVAGGACVVDTYQHLYVSVKQGEYLRLWVNGSYIGEVSLVGMTMYSVPSEVFRFGGCGNNYYHGEIDQLLVWDYAGGLVQAEYLYNSNSGVPTSAIKLTESA